jgi:hypothetical protein
MRVIAAFEAIDYHIIDHKFVGGDIDVHVDRFVLVRVN